MTRIVALLAFVMLLAATPAFALNPDEVLKDPVLEARARDITREVRCLVCQGESIDDSNAQLAGDLRVLVRQRLMAGDSDQQVRDYLVARYGEYVLLRPPVSGDTLVLWGMPFVMLLIAIGVAVKLRKRAGHIEQAGDDA